MTCDAGTPRSLPKVSPLARQRPCPRTGRPPACRRTATANLHSFLQHGRLEHVGERRSPLLPFSVASSSSSSSSSSLHLRNRRSPWPTPPSLPVSSADRATHEDEVLDPVRLLLVLRHEGEDVHQLLCHQQHRSIERRHDRRTVDRALRSTTRRATAPPVHWRSSVPVGFCTLLTTLRKAVVSGLRQCCCDGHPLVSLATMSEPSLPLPASWRHQSCGQHQPCRPLFFQRR